MEDIYGDLTNYEDVNALEELRSENHELKVKLEEHSAAMAKLQKDYDTLEMEFKKLEKNYSSLLITARSEIRRKTQRIDQLNTEKDLMVLNALKSGRIIRRNFNQGVKNPVKGNNEKSLEKKTNNNKGINMQQKNVGTQHERSEKPVLPSKVPDSGIYNKNKSENARVNVVLSEIINKNIAKHKTELDEPPKIPTGNEERKKYTPAVNKPIAKFSSDDELEQNYNTKDKNTKNDNLQTDKIERGNTSKMPIDRHSNKTSETSSMDDRHNYQESTSRDTYKGRSSRYHDNSSYRGRDKYDVSLKYRKHYSPERGQKRQHREYQDDYQRHEQGRQRGRSLESPPPESSSRHQRQKSDYRSDFDRYSYDHEKNRHHRDNRYSAKYRLKDDEPHAKRQRTESYGHPEARFKDDRRICHDKESFDAEPNPTFSPHNYDMLRYSCQSPDYIYTDPAFAKPIKEIMATAATPLEDPRVTSKKYVIWKDNGKETLSTAVGRNINIRPVNKARWNIKRVDMPDALVLRPSHCSEYLVNDIYMDIDNSVTNVDLSMESGEIHETDEEISAIRSKPKVIQRDTQDIKTSKQVLVNLSKQTANVEKVSKSNIAKYRIPKIGRPNQNTQSKMDVPIIFTENIDDLEENVPCHRNVYKKGAAEDSFPKELLTHKQKYDERQDIRPNNIKCSKREGRKSKSRDTGENQNQTMLTKIAIVADDLELSDDNSDHIDTNRRVVPEKIQKSCEMPLNIKENRIDDTVNNVENKTRATSHDAEIGRTADTVEIKNVAEEDKPKESDNTKKQKIKRGKSKSREIFKDSVEITDAIHITEKKTKSKKDKESIHKETKEKFSDLFGDSNSLVTPEDLGIPSYLPVSEDAQDAVDLKISQIINDVQHIDNDFPDDEQTHSNVEVTIRETTAHDDNPKDILQTSNIEVVTDKEVNDITKNNKPSERKEEIIDPNQLPSPIVYQNLNPGTDSNDPNVVKTVIISTGKQPEIMYENNLEITKPASEVNVKQNCTNLNQFPAIQGFKTNILKALATSTPQKESPGLNPFVADDVGTTSVICEADVNKAVATIPNAEQVLNQTETNTLESNDAPDVRIFVKRRRKVVKRPPMT